MNHRALFRTAMPWLAAALVGVHVSLAAQTITERNPARRLPPTGSQATDIPAGVDTGSPTTSNKMPRGTPVPPALAADREDQNKRSAAARAAARPATTPLGTAPAVEERVAPGPATLGAQTDSRDPGATLPRGQRPVAARPSGKASADCTPATARADSPVALPQSGFVGGSTAPGTASAVARGRPTRPC